MQRYIGEYRIITGHAFIGAYTQRFYPPHSEQITCLCSEPIQTVEHVLLSCPPYDNKRRKHQLPPQPVGPDKYG